MNFYEVADGFGFSEGDLPFLKKSDGWTRSLTEQACELAEKVHTIRKAELLDKMDLLLERANALE